jgi:tripartite-type tricarboxylate transporter receptor subunit TctC
LTLVVTPMSMLGIYPHTYKKLPYDPVADFQPVSQAFRFDFGFAVGPMVPASVRSLGDFIAWCKANPKDANFGSPAAGSVPHFVAEIFGRFAGVDLKHVPYRGTQLAIADLLGGQIAAVSGPVGEFLQHLPGGKIRLIATSGATRNKFAPTVPTFAEQGYKDIVFDEWFGFYMPAKVPAEVLNRTAQAIRNALGSPDLIEALGQMGLEASPSTPAELAALLKALRAQGMSILLVEHDMDFVMSLADRLVVLQFGERLAQGVPQDIQRNPAVHEAYLGGVV